MTVAELIAKLSALPSELEVFIEGEDEMGDVAMVGYDPGHPAWREYVSLLRSDGQGIYVWSIRNTSSERATG